ncbi:MAG: LD-carboxypeptidase [Alphaproteobacteria bacterium]|nr:LD-carboxypeptidase [Alphaproteobacteria bacterium]MBQ9234974.1 LD-carboxypeptidase [Alphaproteobacteria bacterium]
MSLLHYGDTIGLIAPSAGLDQKDLAPAENALRDMGFVPLRANNLTSSYRYMAGCDNARAAAINTMLLNPEVKALMCIRGGAGALRALPSLNFDLLRRNPKLIIGLSDSTALQNAALARCAAPSLSGFLPLYDTQDNRLNPQMAARLQSALLDDNHTITSGTCPVSVQTQGEIVGGCLSVLCQLCGTPYFPDLTDKILLLEDIGEKTYKVDLMLQQLKLQPYFARLRAVIFGAFTDCPIQDPADGSIADCINDFAQDLSIPVIRDFNYGHIPERHLLPLGIKTEICTSPQVCTLSWQA